MSHPAYIVLNEDKQEVRTVDGDKIQVQWMSTGKRDYVPSSKITRGMLSPALNEGIRRRPRR